LTVVAAGLVGALAIGACGINRDSGPRDIAPEDRPADTASDTSMAEPTGEGPTVYLLGPSGPGDRAPLEPRSRDVANQPTSLLTALLEGPTESERSQDGLRTAIPDGTTLRSAGFSGQGTLLVDVSPQFLEVSGDVLLDAVVQIVFTASQIDGVRDVQLLVDGETQDWPTSSGDSTRGPLSVYNFADRLPTSQPDYPAVPSPTQATTTTVPPPPPTIRPRTTPPDRLSGRSRTPPVG
jgi:hypothetical protein